MRIECVEKILKTSSYFSAFSFKMKIMRESNERFKSMVFSASLHQFRQMKAHIIF